MKRERDNQLHRVSQSGAGWGDQSVTDAARTKARADRQNDSLLPENTMDARTTVWGLMCC